VASQLLGTEHGEIVTPYSHSTGNFGHSLLGNSLSALPAAAPARPAWAPPDDGRGIRDGSTAPSDHSERITMLERRIGAPESWPVAQSHAARARVTALMPRLPRLAVEVVAPAIAQRRIPTLRPRLLPELLSRRHPHSPANSAHPHHGTWMRYSSQPETRKAAGKQTADTELFADNGRPPPLRRCEPRVPSRAASTAHRYRPYA